MLVVVVVVVEVVVVVLLLAWRLHRYPGASSHTEPVKTQLPQLGKRRPSTAFYLVDSCQMLTLMLTPTPTLTLTLLPVLTLTLFPVLTLTHLLVLTLTLLLGLVVVRVLATVRLPRGMK